MGVRFAVRYASALSGRRQAGVPVFLAYNFYGNQTVNADPGILPTISWCRNNERFGVTDHDGSKAIRGSNAWSWPVDTLLSEGFGLVTACYNDIYPDGTGNRDRSVIRLFGDTLQRADGWGAISAWAWGLSRIMDYRVVGERPFSAANSARRRT